MSKKIITPLRYPGGKSKAIKYFEKYLKDCKEFREPFVGGGSVFLFYYSNSKADKFIINDLNQGVSSFWKESIFNNRDLVKRIKSDFKNKDKELYNEIISRRPLTDIEKASNFFVLNRITFSGTTESGGYSRQAHLKRFTDSSIERVEKLSKINNTTVFSLDFQKIIERDGDDVFIFLDPPYYRDESSKLYGKKGDLHKGFDHKRLSETLKKTKHNWLMTYDNSNYIKELYKEFYIKEISLKYTMANNSKDELNEVLISNLPFE